jgi:carbon-monoxide dehydrogenase medium subunit
MKAPAFDYLRVASLDEACAALSAQKGAARIIAGGQSLMPAMNMRLLAPELLVDIGGLSELRFIRAGANTLHIGALARHADVQSSSLVAKHAPLLTQAIHEVAHQAIRNRGTIGGNLAHADPASELPACAVALEAVLRIHGPNGERQVPAVEFFQGLFETALAEDEILVGIDVPFLTPDQRCAFGELARRRGDYAMVGLAARIDVEGDVASNIRLVFFSVGETPMLATMAAATLDGKTLDDAKALQAAQAALDADLSPPEDLQASTATRLHLARVLLGRVWTDLATSRAP